MALTEECSSRIRNKLPTKLKYPGSFTMQIKIVKCIDARGLCDLGTTRPDGIIEDVLVQVGSLIFPVDFVILDFEPDPEVPFILGHHFLATRGALIDMAASRLTMRAHDKVEVFDVYKAMRLPAIYEDCQQSQSLMKKQQPTLSEVQVEASLEVLKRRKKAIGW
ncbi:uncharacterized protein LOC125873699 [Solanum stenotomum]|uniref:uncharacterized protein LOC125873699 n=1 Tax=Solanum stenotomum TaxID=172797 RepID=UPI0020D1B4EA|nr:uncharacterized protein LOC125873699 [Solanum stenotomum]